MKLEEINKKIRKRFPLLKKKYKVKSLAVFGSFLRNEQKKKSDLDLLVDFSETISLFDFVELEDFLSGVLGIKVDLVMRDSLKPRIKDEILKQALTI